jgi:hypothetical protein
MLALLLAADAIYNGGLAGKKVCGIWVPRPGWWEVCGLFARGGVDIREAGGAPDAGKKGGYCTGQQRSSSRGCRRTQYCVKGIVGDPAELRDV